MTDHIKKSEHSICIAGQHYSYTWVRSRKRKRSIALKITNDLLIQVNSPFHTSISVIEDFLFSRQQWLISKIKDQSCRPSPRKLSFIEGEQHWFKGTPLLLKLVQASQNDILLKDQYLYVFHRKNSHIEKLLKQWYRQQAIDYLDHRTHSLAQKYQLPMIKMVKVRYMKARWGSCSSDAVITYNVHLIKAPLILMDYVILHELAHLIHHNHSAAFYRLQTQLNPQWKTHKRQLDQLQIL